MDNRPSVYQSGKVVKSVSRRPLYASMLPTTHTQSQSTLVLARVKQPPNTKQPINPQYLELRLPDIPVGQSNRNHAQLEKNVDARSTWTLIDHAQQDRAGHFLTFAGLAEPSDINNRTAIMYRDDTHHTYQLFPVIQLNMQKKNQLVSITTLEQVEQHKARKAQQQSMTSNQIIKEHDTIQDVAKAIMREDSKKKKASGKTSRGVSSKKIAFGDEGGDEWNVGDDDQWEKFDDDEEIKNRDLIDFEETGDWDATKSRKSAFLEVNDDDEVDGGLASKYTTMDSDSDDGAADEQFGESSMVVKRKVMTGEVDQIYQDEEQGLSTAKRQKVLKKK